VPTPGQYDWEFGGGGGAGNLAILNQAVMVEV
jgi:hypothetical protein